MRAPPQALQHLGRHLIVGYRDPAFIEGLIAKIAIAGVYLTRRNLAGGSLAARVQRWQAMRKARGLAPLIIAADHEGGLVAHLAPPLRHTTTIGRLIEPEQPLPEDKIRALGTTHGEDLKTLGINLNLAPVLDLRGEMNRALDAFSKIGHRAISADPRVVARAASLYCASLRQTGVRCTAKHFPGIGDVTEDTHFFTGTLRASRESLLKRELHPFRALSDELPAMMLSHTLAHALDPEQPASRSSAVIKGLLRDRWGYRGILLTDDLSMFPIVHGRGGVGGAAEDSLRAGADLMLISYDPDLYFEVMAHLLKHRDQALNASLAESQARLSTWFP